MARAAPLAPALLFLAGAAAGFDGQQDAQALFQRAVAPATANSYSEDEKDFFFLTEAGLNNSGVWLQELFREHGSNLLALMDAGGARPPDATCNEGDLAAIRKAMLLQAPLLDGSKESCNTEALTAPEGFEHGLLKQCFQESQALSDRCSGCFLDLAKNAIGSPSSPGCSAHCSRWASWCKERETESDHEFMELVVPHDVPHTFKGYVKSTGLDFLMGPENRDEKHDCSWYMSACYDCAQPHVDDFLRCTDIPMASVLSQAFNDLRWQMRASAGDFGAVAQTIIGAPTKADYAPWTQTGEIMKTDFEAAAEQAEAAIEDPIYGDTSTV